MVSYCIAIGRETVSLACRPDLLTVVGVAPAATQDPALALSAVISGASLLRIVKTFLELILTNRMVPASGSQETLATDRPEFQRYRWYLLSWWHVLKMHWTIM